MVVKHDRSVDLTRPGLPIDLRIVQGDARTHSITYTLYEGSMRWIIPDGTTAVIHYAKGDGTGGEYDKLPDGTEAIELNNNECTITLAEQVLTWAGCVRLQVTLSNQNGQQLSFWETIIKVLPNVAGYVAKSEDYISVTPSAIASELNDLRVDYTGKRHSKAGDAVRESDKSLAEKIDKLNEGGLNLKDDVIAADVSNWLDEHPEATTTVQNGAITETKINAEFLPYITNSYITPQMFGAKGDGISDDTDNIKATITYARDKKSVIVFPAGNYGISEPLDVNFDIKIIGENAFIIPLKDMTHFMGINTTEKTNSGYIFGLGFSAGDTFSVTTGIKISYVANFRLHGLKIFNTTVGIDYIKGYELLVDSCLIRTSIPSEDSIGMDIKTSDSHFSNIIIINYHVGIYDEYGGNFYDKIHAWIANTAIVKNSIYFRANGSAYISQCFNDTYETAIYINGKQNVVVSEFRNFYNSNYINSDIIDDTPVLFHISDGQENQNLVCYGIVVPDVGSLFGGKKVKFSNVEKEKWNHDYKSLCPDSFSAYCDGVPDGLIVYNPGIAVSTSSEASLWDIMYNRIYRKGRYCKLEFAALYKGAATNLNNAFTFISRNTRPEKPKELLAYLSKGQYDIPDAMAYLYIGGNELSLKLPSSTSKFIHFDVEYYTN
jgi:hypothetical protein